MANCSELAETIYEIAVNLSTRQDITTLDDIVMEMRQMFPGITREFIEDSITEASHSEAQKTEEVLKSMRIIREAKVSKNLRESIDEFNEILEEGFIPEKRKKTPATMAVAELREVKDNLRKWIQTSDPVMRQKLESQAKELASKLAKRDIAVARRKGKVHEEISDIYNEVQDLKQKIADERAKEDYLDAISIIESHLENGTLPEPKTKRPNSNDTTLELRSILYELKKELKRSEPAVRKRLEKSIAELENKLRTGDIFPKPKPEKARSEEIDKLLYKQDLLRKEIKDQIESLKPVSIWEKSFRKLDIIRLSMTTGEFSFALRQGGTYAFTHPIMWVDAVSESFRSFASPEALFKLNKQIYNRPNAHLYNKSGLVLLREGMSLTKTEEVIMNYWQDKMPIARNFNRAAIAFFNKMRADMFDLGYQTLGRTGEMTDREMEIWANYINVMSGRGGLGMAEPAALFLSRTFFSARYVSSRFQMLGGIVKHPFLSTVGSQKRIHKQIAKEYARLGMGLFAITMLGLMVGADIEKDPRSTDFGKMKFGSKRLDFAMGYGQIIRFASQMLTGTAKTGSGNVVPLREKHVFFNGEFYSKEAKKKYGSKSAASVFGRFLWSKASPQVGLLIATLNGKNMVGDEVTLLSTALGTLPMTWGDILDVMKEDGVPENVALSVLAMLGMGLQTYDSEPERRKYF